MYRFREVEIIVAPRLIEKPIMTTFSTVQNLHGEKSLLLLSRGWVAARFFFSACAHSIPFFLSLSFYPYLFPLLI